MQQTERRFDVVVVAYRSEEHILACLDSVKQAAGLDRSIVVDHGDGASARRAEAAGATVVHDPTNPGFGQGQNRGVALGTAPFVLLLNPDASMVPGAVVRGLDVLAARPDVAAVQGVIRSAAGGGPERSRGREVRPVHLLGRAFSLRTLLRSRMVRALTRHVPAVADHVERVPAAAVDTEWLAATALLVRRTAFEAVGGFSPDYFLYGEDLDLCRRLRLDGWRLVALSDDWAVHDSGASAASTVEREITWWNGTMTFAARWWSPVEWMAALVAAVVECGRLIAREPAARGRVVEGVLRRPLRYRRRR